MALPTNIPKGVKVTTVPGRTYTDEDGASQTTPETYTYTDQSGNPVSYTPAAVSGGDENGYGAGEPLGPDRWMQQGAVNGYDYDLGGATYAYTPYLAPDASIADMIRARGPSGYADPLGAMLQAIENANPNDTLFTPETFDRMNQTQAGRFGSYSSTESLTDLMNKAVQAAGAPDYAVSGAAQIDKAPAVQAYNQSQTDRWNNQQKDPGLLDRFGEFLPIATLASTIIPGGQVFTPYLAGANAAYQAGEGNYLNAALSAAGAAGSAGAFDAGAVDPYADFGGPGYSADINSSLNNAANNAAAAAANADFANTIPPAFNGSALPSYPSGGELANSTIPNYSATSYPIAPQGPLTSSTLMDPSNTGAYGGDSAWDTPAPAPYYGGDKQLVSRLPPNVEAKLAYADGTTAGSFGPSKVVDTSLFPEASLPRPDLSGVNNAAPDYANAGYDVPYTSPEPYKSGLTSLSSGSPLDESVKIQQKLLESGNESAFPVSGRQIDAANTAAFSPQVESAIPSWNPPVTTPPPPDSPLSLPSNVPVPGPALALNSSVYQPVLQALTDVGVPFSIIQALPSVINSALQGGTLSKLAGGSFAKGAGLAALGSVIGNFLQSQGYNVPTTVLSAITSILGKGLGLLGNGSGGGGGSSGLPTQTGSNSGNTSGASGSTTINAGGPMQTLAPAGNLMVHGTPAPVTPTPTPAPTPISYAYNNTTPANLNDSAAYKNNPMFGPTVNAARGGLMHLAEGDLVEAKEDAPSKQDPQREIAARIERLTQLLAPATAKVPSMEKELEDYLRRYQAQQERSTAKQAFISAIGAPTMRGRVTRPSQYAGMPNAQIESALPSFSPSTMGLRRYTEMPNFMPTAKIPFAAHGGQIHPELGAVLRNRNVNVEQVAGPEGRFYAKHDIRGFAVGGPGTGQSDDIPTMLSDGEYVIDADTVAALGDGSSKAGASVLDKFRQEIRKQKRSAPVNDIPPKAKSPMEYLKMARKGK